MNLTLSEIIKKIVILSVLMGMVFAFPPMVISKEALPIMKPVESSEKSWEGNFKQTVQSWIQQIGKNEPLFVEWISARWESYPMGPGMKQWVILILNEDKQEIGYLVVEESPEESLVLIEYGKSEEDILSRYFMDKGSHTEQASHSFLYHGLAMLVNQEGVLLDAITGEAYEHVQQAELKVEYFGEEVSKLRKVQEMKHDPAQAPIAVYSQNNEKEEAFPPTHLSSDHAYYYAAEIITGVKGIYNVLSIHQWELSHPNKTTFTSYIGLSDQGIRFFSIQYLNMLEGGIASMP